MTYTEALNKYLYFFMINNKDSKKIRIVHRRFTIAKYSRIITLKHSLNYTFNNTINVVIDRN